MAADMHIARVNAVIAADAPKYRVAIDAEGHELVADEPPANGGNDDGVSPFGLLLSGLVACTAITLRMYCERKDWPATPLEVDARYDIVAGNRTVLRRITLPAGLDPDQRQRIAEIAEKTPVTKAVRAGTAIVTAFV